MSANYWIMHYIITIEKLKKKTLFLLKTLPLKSLKKTLCKKKKLIHCGGGDGAGIPEPIGDGDEI